MLDSMRRGVTNIFTKLLLGLLIIAFAVWGIGDVVRTTGQNVVATVGSTEITSEEYRQAFQEELRSVSSRLGRNITPEQAKMLGLETRALARLIGFAAIDLHARELGVTVPDNIVANIIRGDPAFKGPTGQFSREQFRRALAQQGFQSEQQYIDTRKRDIVREQLTETVGMGVVPPVEMAAVLHRFRNEARSVEYFTPDYEKHITVPEPDDAKLQAFYDQNKRRYMAPEYRKANLLLLTREEALKRIDVSDEDVKAIYEANKEAYNIPEKRRIQQLTFKDKAAAQKAYDELSKAKNFEEVAAKLGYPAADIDLGLLTREEMIDPKIAEAAFALKQGELSQPVEGQFSIALIRVPEIQPGKQRTFDEVKSEIKDRLANERVGQKVGELHDTIENERAKGRPLKEIAEELKLPFREIAQVDRQGQTSDGKPALDTPDAKRITEAVFEGSPGVETEAIEFADGGYGWFDVVSTTPERQKTFDEVKDQVRNDYIQAEKRREIAAIATKQVERIKGGASMEEVAKELGGTVTRTEPFKRTETPAGLPAAAVQQAFALPKGGVASVATADGASRMILRVADIVPAPPPTLEQTEALKNELASQMRIDLLEQYVGGLRTRYGYNINENVLKQALGPQVDQPQAAF